MILKSNLIKYLNNQITYFIILMLYFECIFHFINLGTFNNEFIIKCMFAIFFGSIIGVLSALLNRIGSFIAVVVLTSIISVFFIAQIIYHEIFKTYLSFFGTKDVTGQALDYLDVVFSAVKKEWWIILLLILPIVVAVVFGIKYLEFKRFKMPIVGLQVLSIITFYFLIQIFLTVNDTGAYSPYRVFIENTSVDLTVKKLGVLESFYLDAKSYFLSQFGYTYYEKDFVNEEEIIDIGDTSNNQSNDDFNDFDEDIKEDNNKDNEQDIVEIDTSPNAIDIDFDKIILNEESATIKSIHEYIAGTEPTNKNEYTGIFEGYNLIFITAEGFSGYVIDKKLTPTLYKLSNSGFIFNNYYSPLWYGSTVAGEYANLTGLIPKNGGYLSMNMVGENKNYMPFTLANQLNKDGYYSVGYHNNDYTYYDREKSHPILGYNWIGVGNGFEPEMSDINNAYWPQSDLYMINETVDEYINKQPFNTYYLTVSGHVLYDFSGNAMSLRHKDYVEELNYSETTKAYIACQYELELALSELILDLEEADVLDNTLIVLAADHVPYDNKDVLDELEGRELEDTFEWYKNSLIIWSASMENKVEVDKYCSSIDILPTVSNLLGLEYDSRMLVGQDILSTKEGLVMFNDRSFITDSCSYNSNTGEVISFRNQEISDSYINNRINLVKNKFSLSESICENDYYKYLKEEVEHE